MDLIIKLLSKLSKNKASLGAWTYENERLEWLSDYTLRSQLPPLYRVFGLYCEIIKRFGDRKYVRGAEKVLNVISNITKNLNLKDRAKIEFESHYIYVDLLDPYFLQVVHENNQRDTNLQDLQVLPTLLEEGDTFIDIGANHGSFSIFASQIVGAEGMVIAVEPQPRLAALLRRTLRGGGSPHAVWQVALGDKTGKINLYKPMSTSAMGGIYKEFSSEENSEQIKVPLRKLDDIIDTSEYPGRIVIKIDAEGGEHDLLKGARKVLSENNPPLILEINPKSLGLIKNGIKKLKRKLVSIGYEVYSRVDGAGEEEKIDELKADRQKNIIVK